MYKGTMYKGLKILKLTFKQLKEISYYIRDNISGLLKEQDDLIKQLKKTQELNYKTLEKVRGLQAIHSQLEKDIIKKEKQVQLLDKEISNMRDTNFTTHQMLLKNLSDCAQILGDECPQELYDSIRYVTDLLANWKWE